MKDSAVSVALKLFIITAVAALCLAAVNMVTEPIIEANTKKAETESKMEVLPQAKQFESISFSKSEIPEGTKNGVTIEKLDFGKDDKGDVAGYVVTAVSANGYGGNVKVMIGLDPELKVVRAKIIEAAETPGLGGNASKPQFIDQFKGKSGGLTVVKGNASDESQISAISSATITSKAVTSTVNAAVELMETKLKSGFSPEGVSQAQKSFDELKKETEKQISGADGEATDETTDSESDSDTAESETTDGESDSDTAESETTDGESDSETSDETGGAQ